MTDTQNTGYSSLKLPLSIVTRIDLARLVTEIEKLDSSLQSADVRSRTGAESVTLEASDVAQDFLQMNSLSLDDTKSRQEVVKNLRQLKAKAPKVHASFAIPADHDSLVEMVKWFRESVNPQVVLDVGLQPDLIAGVYLRTDNHVHDFSLRSSLNDHHDMLVGQLKELV